MRIEGEVCFVMNKTLGPSDDLQTGFSIMAADTKASDSQYQPAKDAKASSVGHGSAVAKGGQSGADSAAKNGKRRNQKMLSVVVTLDEAARIERLARERGKSVSAYLKERGLGVRQRKETPLEKLQDCCVHLSNVSVSLYNIGALLRERGEGNDALNDSLGEVKALLDQLARLAWGLEGKDDS